MKKFNQRQIKISKYLSYHLRHRPERLGLQLAPGGWVNVEQLLAAATEQGFVITMEELKAVVSQNDKQRFAFDRTGQLIRANQGHSISVELDLLTAIPPAVLYHGTYKQALASIWQKGLVKMQRHHVHLSSDYQTALKVGKRRGKPVVLKIDTEAMVKAGINFYRSENGVWLADSVPQQFIQLSDQSIGSTI